MYFSNPNKFGHTCTTIANSATRGHQINPTAILNGNCANSRNRIPEKLRQN